MENSKEGIMKVRTVVLAIIGIVAFIGYVFGYQYFTGNTPNQNKIIWFEWSYTVPFSVSHQYDLLTGIVMLLVIFGFWRAKVTDEKRLDHPEYSEAGSMWVAMLITVLIGIIVGFCSTVYAVDHNTTIALQSTTILSIIIGGILGLAVLLTEQNDGIKETIIGVSLASFLFGLWSGLGAAIPVLPVFGTTQAVVVWITTLLTTVVSSFSLAIFTLVVKWLLGQNCQTLASKD